MKKSDTLLPVFMSGDDNLTKVDKQPVTFNEERSDLGIEEEQKQPLLDKQDDENDWVDVVSGASSDHQFKDQARTEADQKFDTIFSQFESEPTRIPTTTKESQLIHEEIEDELIVHDTGSEQLAHSELSGTDEEVLSSDEEQVMADFDHDQIRSALFASISTAQCKS